MRPSNMWGGGGGGGGGSRGKKGPKAPLALEEDVETLEGAASGGASKHLSKKQKKQARKDAKVRRVVLWCGASQGEGDGTLVLC